MKSFSAMALAVGSVLLVGCPAPGTIPTKCPLIAMMSTSTLRFDGTSMAGKKLQIISDGQPVRDTCDSTIGPLEGRAYEPMIAGAASSIVKHFWDDQLPLTEVIEIRARTLCTDPLVSLGSAVVTYSYVHHETRPPGTACRQEYQTSDQAIVLQ